MRPEKHEHFNLAKNEYFKLVGKYFTNKKVICTKWNKLLFNYRGGYRNVNKKIKQIEEVILKFYLLKDRIKHWDSFLFALYYFDVVHGDSFAYDAEKSMEYAKKHLCCMNIPAHIADYTLKLMYALAHPQSEMDRPTQYAVSLIMAKRYEKQSN